MSSPKMIRPKRIKSKYALFKAIPEANSIEDYEAIINYIDKHDDPTSIRNSNGDGPLHLAIRAKKCELVDSILALQKLSPDQGNKWGYTPLHLSLEIPCETCLRALLQAGVDVNKVIRHTSEVPLHLAAYESGRYCRFLIQHGALATLNATDSAGNTPLMIATRNNQIENGCLLLYYGADPSIADRIGFTPLIRSLMANNELQEILLEYEADLTRVDDDDKDCLYYAVIRRSPSAYEIARRMPAMEYSPSVYKVLHGFAVQNHLEAFRTVWEKVSFDTVDASFHRLIQIAANDFRDIIVQSNAFKDILERLDVTKPIEYLITRACVLDYPDQNTFAAIYILLVNGVKPKMVEIELVYTLFGYSDLFKTLLFIERDDADASKIIPDIIFSVNMTVNCVVSRHTTELMLPPNDYSLIRNNLEHFFKFCTNYSLIEKFKSSCMRDGVMVLISPYRRVASLQELSRNQARFAISQRYNVKNACDFYTILPLLPIPPVICEIIAFEFPLYADVEVDIYSLD